MELVETRFDSELVKRENDRHLIFWRLGALSSSSLLRKAGSFGVASHTRPARCIPGAFERHFQWRGERNALAVAL